MEVDKNEEMLEALEGGVRAWNKFRLYNTSSSFMDIPSFPGDKWIGGNFSELTLDNIELSGKILTRSTFVKSSLRGAILKGADLRWADLRWADLRGADLRGADFHGCTLSEILVDENTKGLPVAEVSPVSETEE